ncbi:MAG: energy-coupling factor ABC transporter permease [Methanomassiliicoccales archaeon]|nr:energy-coupling factor ABC transporter permease [Methanomassiliicoccales archaeon]
MHIPDGLMAPEILAIGWMIALAVIAFSVFKVNKKIDEKTVPLMAILAAGIFVAQMLNFPIFGGTTGHLVGAALAAVLVGPYAAVIILTVILVIQCFVFGDGGLTALGLNLTNMAVIGTFVAWGTYKLFPEKLEKVGVVAAAWASVFVAAFACALELAASFSISSGAYGIEAAISLPSMLGYHAVIGIGEGIITGAIFLYLTKVAPEIIKTRKPTEEVTT